MAGNYKILRYKKKSKMIISKKPALTQPEKQEVAKIAKRVDMRGAETKYADISANPSLSWNWNSQTFTIAQGDSDSAERIGDELTQRSVRGTMSFVCADTTNVCRAVLIRWLATTAPTAADIFSNDGSVYAPHSMYRHDKRSLFHVIYDTGIVVLANAAGGKLVAGRSFEAGLKNYKQRFDAGSSTAVKGKLYLWYCSDSSVTTHPSMVTRIRMNYVDS